MLDEEVVILNEEVIILNEEVKGRRGERVV